ncbi:MAG: hypothetical protein ACYCOU_00125 [Sulfobacillus sp.]
MKSWFYIMVIPDGGDYSPERIRALLKDAEAKGYDLSSCSYLHQMTIRQLDELLHGRTDA